MLNPKHSRLYWHDQGHSSSKVACSTAHIQSIPGLPQLMIEQLKGPSMHVWSRYGGSKANTLRRVIVRHGRAIELPVNLFHDVGHFRLLNDMRMHQVFDKMLIASLHHYKYIM